MNIRNYHRFVLFQVSALNIIDIEKKTRKQVDCREWYEEKRFRITASRFGAIVNASDRKNLFALAKNMIEQHPLSTPAINHGILYEKVAKSQFETKFKKRVQECGLFVDENFPFLGASPDVWIRDENATLEIKCPYRGRNDVVGPNEMFPFFEKRDDGTHLKKSHRYYLQIQGQLNISNASVCYFIVYTHVDLFTEIIKKDQELFHEEMLQKLIEIYEGGFYRAEAAYALCNY